MAPARHLDPVAGDDAAARSRLTDLLAAARGDGSERWRSIAALGRSPFDEAHDALTELAASRDWTVRRAAIESLGQHRPAAARATALLRAALHDPSSYVVHAACFAIAASTLTELRPVVLALLHAPHVATRGAALRAIDALWIAECTAPVIEVHRGDPDEGVRREAAFILHSRTASDWWPTLVEMWRSDPLPRHRAWACDLASRSGLPELREAVRGLADDPDGHVRKAALAVGATPR